MAPEQHRGADVDARSDQFAFCVTLFEALYGARPFTGNTLLDLMTAKDNGEIARQGGDVPSWLKTLVLRGLEADPAKRFPSMDELIAELESHRETKPRRTWIGLVLLLLIPLTLLGYRSLTTQTVPIPTDQIAALRAEVAERDDELKRNQDELDALRARPRVDPADVVALELRNDELQAEVERLLREMTRRSSAETDSKASRSRPGIAAARSFEMPGRESLGPDLPERPEPDIIASVFGGLRPAIAKCAGIPSLTKQRSFEEWEAIMDRPIDVDIGVTLNIEPEGRANRVRVSAHDAGVRACVSVVVRRARFPVSIKGGSGKYNFSFVD